MALFKINFLSINIGDHTSTNSQFSFSTLQKNYKKIQTKFLLRKIAKIVIQNRVPSSRAWTLPVTMSWGIVLCFLLSCVLIGGKSYIKTLRFIIIFKQLNNLKFLHTNILLLLDVLSQTHRPCNHPNQTAPAYCKFANTKCYFEVLIFYKISIDFITLALHCNIGQPNDHCEIGFTYQTTRNKLRFHCHCWGHCGFIW